MEEISIQEIKKINSDFSIQNIKFLKAVYYFLLFLIADLIIIIIIGGTFLGIYNNYFGFSDFYYPYESTLLRNFIINLIFSNSFTIFLTVNLFFIGFYLFNSYIKKIDSDNTTKELLKSITTLNSLLLVFTFILSISSSSNTYENYDYYVPVRSIQGAIFLQVIFLIIALILSSPNKQEAKKFKQLQKSDFSPNISPLKIITYNFLFLSIINFTILIFYLTFAQNSPTIDGIFVVSLTFNLLFPFMYLILNLKMNLPMKKNEKLFFINVALILPFLIQYIDIYLQKNSFSNNNGVIFLDLHFRALLYLDVNLLIIIIILTIIWRNQISKYGKKLLIQLILFSHYTLDKLYNLAKKINPFKIILYKLTIRNLNKNDQAVFFARNFIIIQSEKIRTNLPSMVPKTVDQSFRNIFLQDIDRMYQLLQINKIKTYSKDAVLKFVMSIAKPIIVDMQRTLQEHITLELLKKSNDSKNLKVDIDDLWSKTNKILSQWESTFGDAELKYKDTLLHK